MVVEMVGCITRDHGVAAVEILAASHTPRLAVESTNIFCYPISIALLHVAIQKACEKTRACGYLV